MSHQQHFHWMFDYDISSLYNFKKIFFYTCFQSDQKDSVLDYILQDGVFKALMDMNIHFHLTLPFISFMKTSGSLILPSMR